MPFSDTFRPIADITFLQKLMSKASKNGVTVYVPKRQFTKEKGVEQMHLLSKEDNKKRGHHHKCPKLHFARYKIH